jgi:adenine phosphoribosyltransferase
MDLRAYIRDIPDFPKPGILFKDVTPLLAAPAAFHHAVDQFVARYRGAGIDGIASAEARGFVFAAPVALALDRPLILLRKPGKLPYQTHSHSYELEYGTAELHMHIDAVRPGMRVLMLDDLLATGGTVKAGCRLVEDAGGVIAGCAFLIELLFLHGRTKLAPVEVFSLIQY